MSATMEQEPTYRAAGDLTVIRYGLVPPGQENRFTVPDIPAVHETSWPALATALDFIANSCYARPPYSPTLDLEHYKTEIIRYVTPTCIVRSIDFTCRYRTPDRLTNVHRIDAVSLIETTTLSDNMVPKFMGEVHHDSVRNDIERKASVDEVEPFDQRAVMLFVRLGRFAARVGLRKSA